jgi:XTP/dITP diphosphohydrolase
MDVYLASGNAHKLEEFTELLHKYGLNLRLLGATDAGGMPDVDESGDTLEENARIKAEALVDRVPEGAWVLSDDSGLLVDALDGAPGVRSARYAGPGGNATANNIKLLHELIDYPMEQRTAHFACVLCFMKKGSPGICFEGKCEGHIMTAPSGIKGFGYDPLFRPLGFTKTFADLGSEVKHNLSHRARAFESWASYLKSL